MIPDVEGMRPYVNSACDESIDDTRIPVIASCAFVEGGWPEMGCVETMPGVTVVAL